MGKILLVEDDKNICKALKIRLDAMGHEVAMAMDASYAMDVARRYRPDMVVLDINLPGGNGFIVADRIFSSTEIRAMPIVFITASKQRELKSRAERYRGSMFLEKPFSSLQLSEAIDTCMSRHYG
jgi:DNA-binding response OmpR family regulator